MDFPRTIPNTLFDLLTSTVPKYTLSMNSTFEFPSTEIIVLYDFNVLTKDSRISERISQIICHQNMCYKLNFGANIFSASPCSLGPIPLTFNSASTPNHIRFPSPLVKNYHIVALLLSFIPQSMVHLKPLKPGLFETIAVQFEKVSIIFILSFHGVQTVSCPLFYERSSPK